MANLIALIILFSSFLGIVTIVFRKIPILLTFPETEIEKKEGLVLKLKKEIKRLNPFKDFSFEIFLQKSLLKIRILVLKIDNKTFSWLQKLREKYQRKKIKEDDNYWKKIKKMIKNK